jgi:hypothetical protein
MRCTVVEYDDFLDEPCPVDLAHEMQLVALWCSVRGGYLRQLSQVCLFQIRGWAKVQQVLTPTWLRAGADYRHVQQQRGLGFTTLLWGLKPAQQRYQLVGGVVRIARRTISRGAMVRKKASRLQLRAPVHMAWVRLAPTPAWRRNNPPLARLIDGGYQANPGSWLLGVSMLGSQLRQARLIPSPSTHVQPEMRAVRAVRVAVTRYALCGLAEKVDDEFDVKCRFGRFRCFSKLAGR